MKYKRRYKVELMREGSPLKFSISLIARSYASAYYISAKWCGKYLYKPEQFTIIYIKPVSGWLPFTKVGVE